jgi:hypothetical protein
MPVNVKGKAGDSLTTHSCFKHRGGIRTRLSPSGLPGPWNEAPQPKCLTGDMSHRYLQWTMQVPKHISVAVYQDNSGLPPTELCSPLQGAEQAAGSQAVFSPNATSTSAHLIQTGSSRMPFPLHMSRNMPQQQHDAALLPSAHNASYPRIPPTAHLSTSRKFPKMLLAQ